MLAMPLAVQYALIGAAVVLSLCVLLNQQVPGVVRSWRVAMALRLLRSGGIWATKAGRAVAPKVAGSDACGGCSGCGTSAAVTATADASRRLGPQ